ncbi:PREDICTED: immunoglobulin superfamily member 10-like, partial [Branchiostoma belcheri]|uniref:Immunoglobulin superfamily member 10-like n=1 Tax=Branchiostoma belcheri TaxID=7741 RepID=A0A6P5A8U7_BRABE
LGLSNNKLTTLKPGMFTGLGNVQSLSLSDNEMTDIQAGTFSATSQLRNLNLHNNRLTNLRSDMFTGLGNLRSIMLDENDIIGIQAGIFNSTPQLSLLYLQNNNIQSIPSNLLINLMQLAELRLSDNNITMFPFEDLSTIQRLNYLHLHNNQMTTLPSMAYDILTSISDVKINNNPWQCDCRMVDFRIKMTGSRSFENQINCSQPDSLNGQKLIDINPENLFTNCQDPTIIRFERSKDNILVHGDTLHLVCEATGIPTPDITVILPSGLNATLDVNSTITITNVTAADAGLYVCIADSPVGTAFATLSVDLAYEEPSILRFEKVNIDPLAQGETFRLVCEASGIPTPDITVILPSGQNATVASVGRVTVVENGTCRNTIANSAATDAGLYVCIAVNPAGSTFATLVVDLHTVQTTVLPPLLTPPLGTTSSSQESTTDHDSATTSFSPPVSVVSSPSKQPGYVPTFSLPVLLAAVCGSVAGTLFIGGIILAIWCKRNNQSAHKRPDFSVVFNNTNTTTTVITNGHNLTGQTQPQPTRPPSSQFEPYEDVQPPLRDAVPSQSARGQALRPPNRSNNEPPPVPPPRTASATGYENIPEHAYQPLALTRNQPDAFHHYQSLRRT